MPGSFYNRAGIKRLIRTAHQPMSKSYIPVVLRQRMRIESRFRCGYCLTPELYTGNWFPIIYAQKRLAVKQSLKIYGWLAVTVTNTRISELMPLIQSLTLKLLSSIPGPKFGRSILYGVMMERRFSALRLSGALLWRPWI